MPAISFVPKIKERLQSSSLEATFMKASPRLRLSFFIAFVVAKWPDQDAENAAQASTLKYTSYWGWAPRMLRSGANIAWVMEHANDGSYTVQTTIAHEIGHKLGLSHSTELDAGACHLLNGDNENRLMTHRIGPKRRMGPIRLIHQEWVNIRNSQMLREARNQ